MASYLQARSQGGEWLVRIEDLDPPREQEGAADLILRTLDRFGMYWDGPVIYQSRRLDVYNAALEQLEAQRHSYPCACSRKDIQESGSAGIEGTLYPGTCRDAPPADLADCAIRVRTHDALIEFEDAWQGRVAHALGSELGDFVVRRRDGWVAYQLAVVVDDAAQGITEVVRGTDLLVSTVRQIHLQRLLDLPTPRYAHLPVAVNERGNKLSKQTDAPALDLDNPLPALRDALRFLNQPLPPQVSDLDGFWQWAIAHWNADAVPHLRQAHWPYP